METPTFKYKKAVKVWLIIGLIMIFFQVVIGGVTRLTGSGLSITKWDIVFGTIPPLNHAQWEEAFDLYRETPQYAKINDGMSMADFKFIYFWEYFHRLWARSMGFVFLFPFLFFWRKGWIDKMLMRRLGITVLLAVVVASFGWIMVASGLIDRPWVNAYKLTMHLSLALILFSYLLWTTYKVIYPQNRVINNTVLKKWSNAIVSILAVQIMLGGVMSGMKAGLFYPSWPDMNGSFLPAVLLDSSQWTVDNFVQYDSGPFMAALIQFLHRNTAYLLTIIVLYFVFLAWNHRGTILFRNSLYLLISMLVIQITLGILTVINCIGQVPVGLGVLHQAGALLLLTIVLLVRYQMAPRAV
ncbi:MAG: COX15/CtaA family protein [Saprospiraceae bacterium]|nr:COX15/CtaA family protein [Lewinella sp.]